MKVAIVTAVIIGLYTICNVIYILVFNRLLVPGHRITSVNWRCAYQNTITNSISNSARSFNVGWVMLFTLTIMMIISLIYNGKWSSWIYTTLAIYVFTFIPIDKYKIASILFNKMQFTGRLYCMVILLLMVGVILFMDSVQLKGSSMKLVVYILSLVLLITSMNTVYKYHECVPNDTNQHRIENTRKYDNLIYQKSHCEDYSLKKHRSVVDPDIHVISQSGTYQVIKIMQHSRGTKMLNINLFKGIKYKVMVNRHLESVIGKGNLVVHLRKGQNIISIHSIAPWWNYFTISISILGMIIVGWILL